MQGLFGLWVAGALAGSQPATDAPAEGTPPADDGPQVTSSKAPDSAADMPAPQPEPDIEAAPGEEAEPELDEDATLEGERGKARKKDFNRHGVGVRGGIVVIPTWILARYLETHANALCRGDSVGNFAEDRGLQRTSGCNFYVGGEYVFRQSRIFDIVGTIGYQHIRTPDAYWLDKGEFDGTPQSLAGADYTEVKLGMMFIEADFIARYPIVVTDTVEFGLGGGGGIGLGILFGGVYQTAIGSGPTGPDGYVPGQGETPGNSCTSTNDLRDFTRCTPRYDQTKDPDNTPPNQNDLSDPNAGLFAACSKNNCSEGDLNTFGYRKKQDDVPPVIPVVNLILSARVIIKDTFAITMNGGWNTGFYFGGGINYFFGKQFQKSGRSGPAAEKKKKQASRWRLSGG